MADEDVNAPTEELYKKLEDRVKELEEKKKEIIIFHKDTQIRKFSGSVDDCVSDFIAQVKALFESRQLKEAERIELITSNVSKNVRDELKCCPPETLKSAALILKALESTYGERRCVSELLGQFYNVRQRSSETVRTYSHRLKNAFDALRDRQKALDAAPVELTLLRDHFVSQLNNTLLRKKLKERVYEKQDLSFFDCRDIAIRWAEDEEEGESEVVNVNAAFNHDLLSQLKALNLSMQSVEKELTSLGDRVKALEASGGPALQQPHPQGGRTQMPFTKDGRPICIKCREPGHLARNCVPENGERR